jgi:uncharacterized protein
MLCRSCSMAPSVPTMVRFGHALRDAGVTVGPARIRTFCEAAAALPPDDIYWAGRASLLWRPDQIPIYDEVFRLFFGLPSGLEPPQGEALESVNLHAIIRAAADGDELVSGAQEGTASRSEVLLEKSFGQCTEEELIDLADLLASLPNLFPRRRTRRYERGGRGELHVRRVLRRAAATGGEPLELRERGRRLRVRPILFLIDVSGSMQAYSRGLLLFAHAALRSNPDVDAYAFGTQLTNLRQALAECSFEEALRASEAAVPDWDGGTRIGDAISEFLKDRDRRTDTRAAIAVICSDGLETGDPVRLGNQVERLRRAVHRVVWLNPLKEDRRYEPLARGMREALPSVDVFESGHSVSSLMTAIGELDARPLARSLRPSPSPSPASRRETER